MVGGWQQGRVLGMAGSENINTIDQIRLLKDSFK